MKRETTCVSYEGEGKQRRGESNRTRRQTGQEKNAKERVVRGEKERGTHEGERGWGRGRRNPKRR